MSDLKLIDFSNGIRATEIQYNFNVLEDQIAKERLAVAGYGVSRGLNFVISDFNVTINAGAVVDVTGQEIIFNTVIKAISLPKLTTTTEKRVVASDGTITLSKIPYSTVTGKTISIPGDKTIQVVRADNQLVSATITGVDNNKITLKERIGWAGSTVLVTYSYTNKRYDTVYVAYSDIDDKYVISVEEGTTSTSPSVSVPSDTKYLLGFLEIDPFYTVSGTTRATVIIKRDMKNFRNVYTDNNNNLYICGVPFKDLQIVHMNEPNNPIENTLWYDGIANKLRVWKTVGGISDWVTVNDTSVMMVKESKTWDPTDVTTYPNDLQTFSFDQTADMNMLFNPNRNQLEVIIDNIPLHSDQFTEVTTLDPENEYRNIGVGFKLVKPLDRAAFVEAKVTHGVLESPLVSRLQRSATFVANGTATGAGKTIIDTSAPYRYEENQLEVFLDGKRLIKDTDYQEGTDLTDPIRGNSSKQFTLINPLTAENTLAYKITTSVYSYDHVNELIEDLKTRMTAAETKADSAESTATQIANSVDQKLPKGLIDAVVTRGEGNQVDLTDIKPEDFVTVFDMLDANGNKVLRRGIDYTIVRDPALSTRVYIELNVATGTELYITGFKLGS